MSFAWLLVALVVVGSDAASIVSERSNLVSRNGRIYSNKTITVRCSESDFGNPFVFTNLNAVTNLTQTINITCGAPRISYSGNVVGKVPRNGKIVRRQAPILRDPTRYDPDFVDGLAIDQAIKDSLGGADRGLLSIFSSFTNILGGLVCGIAGGLGFCSGGGDPISRKEFDDWLNRVAELNASLERYNNASRRWENNITDQFSILNRTVDETIVQFNSTQYQFKALSAETALQAQFYNESLRRVETTSNEQQVALVNTQAKILDLSNQVLALTGAGNATLRQTMEILNNFSASVDSTLQAMQRIGDDRMLSIDSRLMAVSRSLRQTQALIREVTLRTATRRHLTKLMLGAVQSTLVNVDGFKPFLSNLGTQPATQLGLYGTMAIDRQYVTYAYTSGGTLYAKQVDMTYLCDTTFMLDQMTSYTSKREILTYLGPVGCDDNVPGSCFCWVFLTEKQCTVNASLLATAAWQNRTTLNQSWCTAALSTTRNEDQFFSGSSLLNAMGSTVCPNVFNGTARVSSNMLRTHTDVPYVAVPGCIMEQSTLFETLSFNIWFTLFTQLVDSYSKATVRLEVYTDYIDGIIPLNISVQQQPFTRAYGQNAELLEGAFMAYSPEMLNVSKYTNPSISTTVTVKVDNVTRNQSDVALSLPIGFVLDANLKFVGDPFSSTFVYDIDGEDIPLAPTASTREGAITYPMCLNLTRNCTLDQWGYENEATFNHYQGDNVPEIYRIQVNGVQKRCNGTRYAQTGSVCTIMDNFFLEPAVNGLVLEPRTATYEVDIFLQEGLLTIIEFSDCPSVEVIPISASGVVLSLSNSRAVSIVVAIVEDNPNAGCDRTLNNIVVGAGSTYRHFVPACVQGGATIASVFKYEGTDLVACTGATNLNVTINRSQYIQTQGAADALYVDTQTVAITDKTSLDLYKAMNDLTNMVQNSIVATVTMIHSVGLPIANVSYDAFNQILVNVTQTRNEIEALLLTSRNRTALNISGLLDDLNARLAIERAKYDQATNASLTSLNTLRLIQYNLSTSLAILLQARDDVQEARDAYVNATQQYLGAEVRVFERIFDSLDDFSEGGLGLKFLKGLWSVLKSGVGTVYNGVKDLVKDIVELGLKALGGLAGFLASGLGFIVFIIMIVIIGGVVCVSIFLLVKLRGLLFSGNAAGAAAVAGDPVAQEFINELKTNTEFRTALQRLGYKGIVPSVSVPVTPASAPAVTTAGKPLRNRKQRGYTLVPTDHDEIDRQLNQIEDLSYAR